MREGRPAPFIRRIFARDLTAETHGNAIGIGLAGHHYLAPRPRGWITSPTYINALTALTLGTREDPHPFRD